MKEPTYTDTDLMPFGEHRGKPLSDVPVRYLFWYWTETDRSNVKLRNYIENNLDALKMEYPDGIWK